MKVIPAVLASLFAFSAATGVGSHGEVTFTAAVRHPGVYRLYGVRRDGSGLRIIRSNVSHPSRSPDGSRVAFLGQHGFYVADVNGRHLRIVLRASCASGADDAWSPDGSLLALACTTSGNPHSAARIVVVRADGTDLHRVRSGRRRR